MATYSGRISSPISQYIDGLNMIPAPGSNMLDNDPALFDTTQFFDFDLNRPLSNYSGQLVGQASIDPTNPFADFTNFSPANSHAALSVISASPFASLQNSNATSMNTSPANGIQDGHPVFQSRPTVPTYSHFQKHFDNVTNEPSIGEKRSATAAALPPGGRDIEEPSHYATEEDKRRRNTAASARFRVKKKQREQALEKNAKDMGDKVRHLETRVNELEMENKWLKEMLIEKNLAAAPAAPSCNPESSTSEQTAEETSAAAKQTAAKQTRSDDSSLSEPVSEQLENSHRKRGIGTTE